MRYSILVTICLACCFATTAPADDTPIGQAQAQQQDDWNKLMELGKIDVRTSKDEQSERIVAGLMVIKHALKANLSNDPADSKVVVCRMNYDTGTHLNTHLMCATNQTMTLYRERLHTSALAANYGQPDGAETQELEHMKGRVDPSHYFSTEINASELQKLLLQVQCEGCSNSGLVVGDN